MLGASSVLSGVVGIRRRPALCKLLGNVDLGFVMAYRLLTSGFASELGGAAEKDKILCPISDEIESSNDGCPSRSVGLAFAAAILAAMLGSVASPDICERIVSPSASAWSVVWSIV